MTKWEQRWRRMREAGKLVLMAIGGVSVLFMAYFLLRGTPRCYNWNPLTGASTPAPCPGSTEEIEQLRQQIAQLQLRTEEGKPKVQEASLNLNRLEKSLGAVAQALQRQNESLKRENAALQKVVRRLRRLEVMAAANTLQPDFTIPPVVRIRDEGLSRGDPGGLGD